MKTKDEIKNHLNHLQNEYDYFKQSREEIQSSSSFHFDFDCDESYLEDLKIQIKLICWILEDD